MNLKLIKEEELPYELLADLGLTREMIEDLPLPVLDELLSEGVSPVLPLTIIDEENHKAIAIRSRISLTRNSANEIDVLFFPELESAPLSQFTEEEQAMLKEGRVIMADVKKDGETVASFVQIDPTTKQVVSIPTPVIGRNVQIIADAYHLTSAEQRVVYNGDPITFLVNDQPVTMGIDLNDGGFGIRMENGDVEKWKNNEKREWDKFSFGAYGCWVCDENGDMNYVSEDDYDDELWSELKRKREQSEARFRNAERSR